MKKSVYLIGIYISICVPLLAQINDAVHVKPHQVDTKQITQQTGQVQTNFPVTISVTDVRNSLGTLKIADVEHTGKKKIFATFKNNDIVNPKGCLEVLNADGTEMFDIDRNPATKSAFALFDTYLREFAIGNIYGSGQCQVITATRDASQVVRNNYISCHSFLDNNGDGKPDLLWKTQTGGVCFDRNPIIANLDNSPDGSQEIVLVADGNSSDRKIMILNNRGNVLHEFGKDLISYAAPAVADLDNDGDLEIIVSQREGWGELPGCVNVYHHDGRPFGPQPFYQQYGYDFKTPVIADINGDGIKEIILGGTKGNDGKTYTIYVLRPDGTLMPGWGKQTIINKDSRPHTNYADWLEIAVGDLKGDGNLEVVAMGVDTIKIWNKNGVLVNSIYSKDLITADRAPILADVDGDNEAEIIYGKSTAIDNAIYAVKMDGRTVPGFPLYMIDSPIQSNLCVDDVDGDGKTEIIASVYNYIYMWETQGRADRIEWGSARHNCRNTGEYIKNMDKSDVKFPVTVSVTDARNSLGTLRTADVEHTGKKKIFATFTNSSTVDPRGCLEVLNADGTEMYDIDSNPNTNSAFALSDTYLNEFAIGNIYGSGQYYVVATTRDAYRSERKNSISCYSFLDNNHDGKPDLLWQTQTGGVCFGRNPIMADLDKKTGGGQEIVLVADGNSSDRKIMVLNNKGEVEHEFGKDLISYAEPAVANLDNDDDLEIIVSQRKGWGELPGCVNVYHHDGRPFGPQPFYQRDGYDFKTPVIADIDEDGRKEIIVPATRGNDGKTYTIHVLKHDRTLMPGWGKQTIINKDDRPYTNFADLLNIAVGDLDGDGKLEVVAMGVDTIKIWDNKGVLLNNIYSKDLVTADRTPILADVDGDNEAEIIYGKSTAVDNAIYAVKMDGSTVPGFPLYMIDSPIQTNLCVDDVDGDGKTEIIASVYNYIYMWKTEGRADRIEWGSARHDFSNTGEYIKKKNINELQTKFPVTISVTDVRNSLGTLKTADVEHTGKKKIFATFTNNDLLNPKGCLEVLNPDGTELFDIDRNPATNSAFALSDTYLREFAIGNIYGTGQYQVISTTRDASQAVRNNYISCHSFLDNNGDGKPDLLWQTQTGGVCFDRSPIIANLDNSPDDSQEIVLVADGNSSEKKIMVMDNNGNVLHEFGTDLISYSAPAVADLDNDGDLEIIVCQSKAWGELPGCVNVYHHNGTPFGPQPFYIRENYDFKTPVIADINGDGRKEIIVPATRGNDGKTYTIHVLKHDGTLMPGWGRQTIINKDDRPYTNFADLLEIAVGDLNEDGNLEVVAMGLDTVKIWNKNGGLVRNINSKYLVPSDRAPILADVDGDNEAEIIYSKYTNNDHGIYAVKMSGQRVPGFPLFMIDSPTQSNLCVDDVDGDGKNEIIASVFNYIYMWKTKGRADRIEWGSARHNSRNTGEYISPSNNRLSEKQTADLSDQTIATENIEDGNRMYQNFPNPFSVSTAISYVISANATHAELRISDLSGRQIRCFPDLKSGTHTLSVPGNDLKPGMYIYSLFVDGQMIDAKRMILTE